LELNLLEGFEHRVREAHSAVAWGDPAAAISQALEAPTGGLPITELARG
jgi:hypothetical protein